MADINDGVLLQEPSAQTAQPEGGLSQDIAEQMAFSLRLTQPPASDPPADGAEPGTATAAADTPDAPPVKPWFEEQGYASQDEAIAELKALKERGVQAPPEIKFENEQSEKLFRAIQAGKVEEVYQTLAQQQELSSLITAEVTEENAERIIKTGMRLKHPSLTADEIAFQYRNEYKLPKEPRQAVEETDEEFAERKAEWDEEVRHVSMRKIINAKLLKPELESQSQKIVLPDIEPQPGVGDEQAEAARLAEAAQTREAYGKLPRTALKIDVPFIDEANNIRGNFSFEPDEASFKSVIDTVSDSGKFWSQFRTQDGSPKREDFAKALYYGLHIEKVVTEAIKYGKNAALKRELPDNSGNVNKALPDLAEPSELDQYMQRSLNGYIRR